MNDFLPYVDPTGTDATPLTEAQVARACGSDGCHVLPLAALERIGTYRCTRCGAEVKVDVPLIERVTS